MAMPAAYRGPDCDLAPDARTISQFIGWWFNACTRGKIEIGWLDADGRGLIHFLQFDLGSPEIVPSIIQANLVPGQSIYVRAATVRSRTDGYTTDADFVQAPGPWGDIDTVEQMERAKLVQTIVRPNGSVITGLVPHMRAQSFFRVSEPISHPDLVRSLNRRIWRLFGGDSAVINPTRLMRMPGTIAWPWKDARVPEVTTFVQANDRQSSYPLSTLTSQLPADEEAELAAPGSAGPSGAPLGMKATLNTAGELIRLIQSGTQWHNTMVRLVAHWIGRGWSNAEILAASECLTLSGFTISQTRAEVMKAIEGGRARWGVPDLDHIIAADPDKPFPDKVYDPWDTLRAPAFPIHALPMMLRGFVEERARIMGADPCGLAWSCISAGSAALDGRVRLRLKRHDMWSVPPAIWVALIGPSSSKKTPMINEAWAPLDIIQQRALKAYAEQMRMWRLLPKDQQMGHEPPKPLRLLTHDATMEAMQDILSNQDRGIGVVRDELAGWIGGMDKYANGRGGTDRAFWLQSYNGGSHVVDRVGRGTTVINNLLAAVCGGIQPDRLAQLAGLMDDGLWQRLVPIIVRPSVMGVDEVPSALVTGYAELMEGLVGRANGMVTATLSDAAHEIRSHVEREVFGFEQQALLGRQFTTFVGKLPGLFGRLCLVLSYMEPSGLGYIVSEAHAVMAQTLIMQCVLPHAAQVYAAMGSDGSSVETSQSIAGYLLVKKLGRLLASDLSRNVRPCRNQPLGEIANQVSPLVAGGWLEPESNRPGNHAWRVNPIVHITFANRASTEATRRKAARALLTGKPDEE